MERRAFLGTLAAGAAVLGRRARRRSRRTSSGSALIGCGWYGLVVTEAAFKAGGVEVVGICDVDTEHLVQAADRIRGWQGSSPRAFKDWRRAARRARAPGGRHRHPAPLARAALHRGLQAGPRHLLREAARLRRARGAGDGRRREGERPGHPGRVPAAAERGHPPGREARGGGPRRPHRDRGGPDPLPRRSCRTRAPVAPPASLDWDLWCGPAPKLPYSPQVGHFHWRLEKAYGNGHLVDWGIHWIDAIRTVLGLGMPRVGPVRGRPLRAPGAHHDARRDERLVRLRRGPRDLEPPALRRRRVRARDEHRDVPVRREGDDLLHRLALRGDPRAKGEAPPPPSARPSAASSRPRTTSRRPTWRSGWTPSAPAAGSRARRRTRTGPPPPSSSR